VPDLRTRKAGIDWPAFLGPDGTSKSPETGIRTEWGETGPPLPGFRRRTRAAPDLIRGSAPLPTIIEAARPQR